ncbi:MAG: DUF4401 domain-containing protein [Desulfovibrio sp.]|jgi:hypothetical protein|nr:DUF4401 domain-containing protein [Desulfovibrio sp.]
MDEHSTPPLTRNALCRLRARGELGAAAWEEALAFTAFRPDRRQWLAYWRGLLLLCGMLLFVAGIVFFIAANWNGMHRFARFGLTGGAILAFGLASLRLGPDSPRGKVCLLACGLAVGPHLAVFGQTYQTGAELWQLFRLWCAVLFLLALAGRQSALWMAVCLTGNLWGMLYCGDIGRYLLLPEPAAASLAALAVWELAARKADASSWLRARWLPRLLYLNALAMLTVTLCVWIVERRSGVTALFLPRPEMWAVFLYITACLGGCALYRLTIRDLFMPALALASLSSLLVAALVREKFLFYSDSIHLTFLVWGLIIAGLTAAQAGILTRLQRDMSRGAALKDGGAAGKKEETEPSSGRTERTRSWPALWAHLQSLGLLDSPPGFPAADRPEAPWYVQALLAVGGWLAALLFLAFLAFILKMAMGDSLGMPLIGASLLTMAAARPLQRAGGAFSGNLGFALALAGAGGVYVGLEFSLHAWSGGTFLIWAAFLAASIPLMPGAAYRFLASLAAVCLVPVGMAGTLADFPAFLGRTPFLNFRITTVWWTLLCAAIALCWSREKDWLGSPRPAAILPPALNGAFAGMTAYLLAALLFSLDLREMAHLPRWNFLIPHTLIPGPALGMLIPAWLAAGSWAGEKPSLTALPKWKTFGPILACVVSLATAGYFVPGLILTMFGFALARRLSNPVLLGASGVCLFLSMVCHYYTLALPLTTKSLLLAATGAALLGASHLIHRVPIFAGLRPDGEDGRA